MTEQSACSIPIRIYIEDTDAGGIVFYANYLKYFERARTEFMRAKGFELRRGMAENINYVVHSLELKYLHSAKLDDLIDVFAEIVSFGRTYLIFKQWAANSQGEVLVEGTVKVACIKLDSGKPRVLPPDLLARLGIENN